MKKNYRKTGLDLNNLALTAGCILNTHIEENKHASFIELCEKAKVIYRFGSDEDPNLITGYEYTCENEGDEGTKWYILLNQCQGKKSFLGWSYFEEDIKKIFHACIVQIISNYAEAA